LRTFILLSAVPGAGKSTWANAYAASHNNVYIVSSDEVRKEVTGEYQNFTQEPMVWEVFRQRIHEYAAQGDDVTVIADAVNDTNVLRIYYAKEAHEFDKKIFVFIHKELDVVLKQNFMRAKDKWVPPDIIEIFFQKMEQPSEEAIKQYDQYILIT
jgi:tRNA uridine 5-carbamoylmethylation protein Kti12